MANADTAAEKIRVECDSCGAAFRVAAAKAGRRGPCPKCGTVLTVPPPEPEPAEDFDLGLDPPAEDEEDGGGYRLADDLPEPTPAPRPRVVPAHAAAATGAPGRPLQYATPASRAAARAAAAATPPRDGGTGKFVLGVTLAAVFGVVCGVILLLATAFLPGGRGTGRVIGVLVWGLGAAVGGGMLLGYGKQSVPAGAVAAGIALLCVGLGKIVPAVLLTLAGSTLAAATAAPAVGSYTPALAALELPDLLVDDLARADGLDYETTSEEQDAAYHDRAAERVKGMDPATLELTYKRQLVHERMQADERAAALDHLGDFAEDEPLVAYAALDAAVDGMDAPACDAWLAGYAPAGGPGFFSVLGSLLSPLDLLWGGLAVVSAFKISGL